MDIPTGATDTGIQVDSIDDRQWSTYLDRFDDASFYQTWQSGTVQYRAGCLSHLLIKQDEDVIAIAQVGIRKMPGLFASVANVHFGPLWRIKGQEPEFIHFRRVIAALVTEYADKRRHLLRIWPNEMDDPNHHVRAILLEFGLKEDSSLPRSRTLILDLTPTMAELRTNLLNKWRQALANAERNPALKLDCGSTNEHYGIALSLYREMYQRKKFARLVDMDNQGLVQNELPDSLKMKILICKYETEPIAALGWSTIGNTGLPLIAATGNKAVSLSTNASNLLFWKMVEDMKNQGCQYCDLGGIDPILNPGGYKFKLGLAGKSGKEEVHVGQFVIHRNLRSWLSYLLVNKTIRIRKRAAALHG